MKLITSEKSGYRWVSSKHSFKNTILTFTNSVPSSFEIEMCSEVTCKVLLLIAGHILKFPCHIITRVFLYFYNLRTVFSDQRTFFTMIIFSFVVWHDSDSCAIITFIYFWTDSPNRLYTLWIQGKCLMFKVELILAWVHLPLNFFSNMCYSTTWFAVDWIHGSSTIDLEEILIWRADNQLYSTVWRVSTLNLHVIWGWLTSEWTKYFTYIKHHLNIWDFVYKIIEQMEIKLQESRHSFQMWVCTLKIQVYHFIPSKQLRWSDLKDISTTN